MLPSVSQGLSDRSRWRPDNDAVTSALILIDLQNDYFADPELARCRDDLLERCNELVARARASGAPVVEVQTVHAHDKSTWALNMREDDQGMALEGTSGAARLDGLREPDHVVVKTRDSAYFGTDLDPWLADRKVDRLVLAGVSTESCIAATAVDAYARDLRVVLVEDAIASVEWRLHDQTLERLHEQYRQEICSASEISFD
jgi:nicotinamidase-related amidase